MKLTLTCNTSRGRKKIESVVNALSDLDAPLRQFGVFLRAKAKRKFSAQGPGWQPLATSTEDRLKHTFTGQVTAHGSLRRTARLRGIEKALPQEVVNALRQSKVSGGGAKLGETIRRYQQLTKFKKSLKIADQLDRALSQQEGRALAGLKAKKQTRGMDKHRLLGKLASTLRASVKKNRLEVFSVVPWAGVHNDGGTAGKGSHIPQREFLALDDQDLDVLAMLIEDHVRGAAGPHGA